MKAAAIPENEARRLEALRRYEILDTLAQKEFDDLTIIASRVCGVPIALISLVDTDRQWFKSNVGLETDETTRDLAFCAHAILQDGIFVIPDTMKDDRFFDNPLSTGAPNIRFYAGAPLTTPDGFNLGTLCVIDRVPRDLSETQREALEALARQTVNLLELRKSLKNQLALEADLVAAKDRAEAANRAKTMFLAHMTHEIRTPMNGIIGMTNLMLSETKDPSQIERLRIIQNSGSGLVDLINDVLDFSKLETEKLEVESEPFSLHDTVRDVMALMGIRASDKGLALTYHFDPDVPASISSDVTRFRQVLTNILSNAIKFTEVGAIEIRASLGPSEGDRFEIRFAVKDSGLGIPEDFRSKLFQSFTQVDASTTRRYGGTGLGLAISKGICEVMGGTISVESTVGKGSTFTFSFKALTAKKSVANAANVSLGASDELAMEFPLDILLVEDDRVNQLVAVGTLQKLGYVITVANDGDEAVKLASERDFDLILMDCQMPKMDGFTATEKILANGKPRKPRIIALTANTMPDAVDRCHQSGMAGFLSKPIDFKDLVDVLRNAKQTVVKSAARSKPLDRERAIARFVGVESILLDITKDLVTTLPKLELAIVEALKKRNLEELARHAHSLRGAAANFDAERTFTLASKIEDLANEGRLDEVPPIFETLKVELKALHAELLLFQADLERMETSS